MVLLGLGILIVVTGLVLMTLLSRGKTWFESQPVALQDLRRIPYFGTLTQDQLHKVSRLIREVRVPEGAWIVREHHAGDALYLVVSGRINILRRGAFDQTLVQSVGPGEFIGEMAVLTGSRRVASAQAETPAVLIHIDRDDMREFLEADSEIASAIWNACDVHSIDLLVRDDERLHQMTPAAKAAWLSSRRPELCSAGYRYQAPGDGHLAVVSGEIRVREQSWYAPAILPVQAGDVVEVVDLSRLVFLPVYKAEGGRSDARGQRVA